MNNLCKEYGLRKVEEPYNIRNIKSCNVDEIESDNIVLKTIIDQIPTNEIDYVSYWIKTSKNFNKVILLSRKDLKACAESLAFLDFYEKRGHEYNHKYEWHETPNLPYWVKYLENVNKHLEEISNILNIEITYYENIFDVNSKERLRIGNLKKNIL